METSELTYKDVFLFSPYDNRYNNELISIEQFKNELRILHPSFKDWFSNIKRILTPGDTFKHIVVMHGYSGCGKTTFVEWLRETIVPEGYCFDIINPIINGRGLNEGKELIETSIALKTIKNLQNKKFFELVLNNWQHLIIDPEIFSNEDIKRIREILTLSENSDFIPIEDVKQFIDNLDFRQKLLVFIVSCLLENTPQNNKSYIFCFDNLDEIFLEYLTEGMWVDILDISSKINGMINFCNINMSFKDRVSFLMIFREANFAVSSTATLSNRIWPIYELTDKFVFPNLGKQILEQRNVFCQNKINYSNSISDLFKILSSEQNTEDIFLPMYNYDARKLSQTCFDLTAPKTINGTDYQMFNVSEKEYKAFPHDLIYGKRGILLNAFIRHLSKNNFLKNLAPIKSIDKSKQYCNKARLILTVFSNLSFPNGFPVDRSELTSVSPIPFTFLNGFDELKEIITPVDYVDNLLEFFNLEKTGWAHLITIYGKTPSIKNGIRDFNFDDELKILLKYINGEAITSDDWKKLNGITIQLNASGYIYLRYIITHFEYINAYKTRKDQNNWHLDAPLYNQLSIDLKEVKWNFEIRINNVLNSVDSYCHNMVKYFDEVFRKNLHYDEHRFCMSKFVFKDVLFADQKNQDNLYSFYATRLISSHIQYIETFRHYLLLRKNIFENIPVDKGMKDKFLDFDGAQKYLIEIILKYLNLNKIINDPTAFYINKLEKLANEILSFKNYEKWIKQ